MSQIFDGKTYLSLKETADKLSASPHYVQQLIRNGTLTNEAGQHPSPFLVSKRAADPVSGRDQRWVAEEEVVAHQNRVGKRQGGVGVSAGVRWMKVRITDAQIAALKAGTLSAAGQTELANTLKSAYNYDREKAKAYRARRAEADKGDGDDEDGDEFEATA